MALVDIQWWTMEFWKRECEGRQLVIKYDAAVVTVYWKHLHMVLVLSWISVYNFAAYRLYEVVDPRISRCSVLGASHAIGYLMNPVKKVQDARCDI